MKQQFLVTNAIR